MSKGSTRWAFVGWGCALASLLGGGPVSAQTAQAPAAPSSKPSSKPSTTIGSGSTGDMPARRPIVTEEAVTASFTIEEVDARNRKLTVRSADGERSTISVPADVQGFDKLRKGDKIEVDFLQSVAVSILPPGAAAPSVSERTMATGSMRGRQITAAAEVVSVNKKDKTLHVKTSSGKHEMVAVQDPALQKALLSLKPGDVVQLTYTEAVAAAIRPTR